jgi:hypothetical protein
MIKITYEIHSNGIVEAQVWHNGQFSQKRLSAQELFALAKEIALQEYRVSQDDKKGRDMKLKTIERAKTMAGKNTYMNIWYMVNWGRQGGGYCYERMEQVSTRNMVVK